MTPTSCSLSSSRSALKFKLKTTLAAAIIICFFGPNLNNAINLRNSLLPPSHSNSTETAAAAHRIVDVDGPCQFGQIACDNPLPHFYIHIPKTGGRYSNFWLSQMLLSHKPQMLDLPSDEQFQLCQMGPAAVEERPKSRPGRDGGKSIRCNMWMSERTYNESAAAANLYTLIRDPREHVLSQYFHCTESTDAGPSLRKKRKEALGTLDNWLETWVDEIDAKMDDDEVKKMPCYDPRNMQSRFVDYDPLKWKNHDDVALSDLRKRFTVIGPFDQMDKALCVTFIHYTGWVPPHCDCTGGQQDRGVNHGRLGDGFSHGVVHHGHSFNTTNYQDELIRKLTEKDMLLYEGVKRLFSEHVTDLENKMNVTLCNKFNKVD